MKVNVKITMSAEFTKLEYQILYMHISNWKGKNSTQLTGGTSNKQISAPFRQRNFGFHA